MPHSTRLSCYIFALAVALASGAFAGTGLAETIHALNGRTFKKAIVTELSPLGATITSSSGIDTLPYEQWPLKLQELYGYDPVELSQYVREGIDGTFAHHEGLVAFAGEVLTLERGRYTYRTFTDVWVSGTKPKPPITGRYDLAGHWLIFDTAEMPAPARILVVVEGRLALMTPFEYKRWKDCGKFGGNVLFRRVK